jgi:hypothetical protein
MKRVPNKRFAKQIDFSIDRNQQHVKRVVANQGRHKLQTAYASGLGLLEIYAKVLRAAEMMLWFAFYDEAGTSREARAAGRG